MKCSRRDEKNVIGTYKTVARVHRCAFHNRQDVALHAFAAYIGPMTAFTAGDLVHFIQENNPATLHAFERNASYLIHVDQLLLFFLDEIFERFLHSHIALARAAAEETGDNILQVDVHFLDVSVSRDLERWPTYLHVYFHHAIVELARSKLLAQLIARAVLAFAFLGLRRH